MIKTPKTRREMEHNVHLVIENTIETKNPLSSEALNGTFLLPNKRIYLPTIDEQLRLQGNMLDTLSQIRDSSTLL
jgi:hypothetical protein